MTLVENLHVWKEAVESYNQGDFQRSLDKFKEMKDSSAKIKFNIGRAYLSLCDTQAAFQAFQEVIKKDEHLAVGHFMLGVVNLMCARHSDALLNFNETLQKLRESKFIDYRQLGLRYKLYKCEVLLNRAVCLSSLGYMDDAVGNLLTALQCKVEPRHNIIDISLNNVQSGMAIEFLVMDAIFQPPKSKTANMEKRDYLGKSQVVVDTGNYEKMEAPLRGRVNTTDTSAPQSPSDSGELYIVLYDFTAQHFNEVSVKAGEIITVVETADDGWFTMVTKDTRKTGLVPGSYVEKYNKEEPVTTREALLKDLRKKETRQSLRRVKAPVIKQPFTRHSSAAEIGEHTYANGFHTERPKTVVDLGGVGKVCPKPSPKVEPKIHAAPPKFRRKNSLENLLANKSPKISPVPGKKPFHTKALDDENNNVNSDDDGYEEMAEITEVKPYAIHDVILPAERLKSINGRKNPDRPAPPPKVVTTMKASPPHVTPRVPRANTVSALVEQKIGRGSPIPKPVKMPPKVPQPPAKLLQSSPKLPQSSLKLPQSPRRNQKDAESSGKEARNQNVCLQFTVTTSLNVSASTTPEDIQNAAKEAINRNIASYLWCEKKDGKRIRLDEHRASNISDLVKNGKLNIWCGP